MPKPSTTSCSVTQASSASSARSSQSASAIWLGAGTRKSSIEKRSASRPLSGGELPEPERGGEDDAPGAAPAEPRSRLMGAPPRAPAGRAA